MQYDTSTGGDIVGPTIFGHNGAATVGIHGRDPVTTTRTPRRPTRRVVRSRCTSSRRRARRRCARPRCSTSPTSRRPTTCRTCSSAIRSAAAVPLRGNIRRGATGGGDRRAAPAVRPRRLTRRRSCRRCASTAQPVRDQRNARRRRRRLSRRERGARERLAAPGRAAGRSAWRTGTAGHRALDGRARESEVPGHRLRVTPVSAVCRRRRRRSTRRRRARS